jgi:hypothetical protein
MKSAGSGSRQRTNHVWRRKFQEEKGRVELAVLVGVTLFLGAAEVTLQIAADIFLFPENWSLPIGGTGRVPAMSRQQGAPAEKQS